MRTSGRIALLVFSRLVRNPISWIPLVVVTGFRVVTSWTTMTVWPSAMADTAVSAFAIGACLLLSTNHALLQERADGVSELLDSMPVTRLQRTVGHMWSAIAVAVLIGSTTVGIQTLALSIGSTSVGRAAVSDWLGAVIVVVTLALLGTALATWSRSRFLAPFVVALAFWAFMQFPLSWLHLVVPSDNLSALQERPPALHLGYTLAIAILIAIVGLLRISRSAVLFGCAALMAVTVVVLGSRLVSLAPPASTANARGAVPTETTTGPATSCVEQGGVEYCAIPGYESWVPLWADVVEHVREAAPFADVKHPLSVRQELPVGIAPDAQSEALITVPIEWGRNGGERDFRRELAGQVAAYLVGLPFGRNSGGEFGCDGTGRSRTLIALWLVSKVEPPKAARRVSEYIVDDSGGRKRVEIPQSDLGQIEYAASDIEFAQELAADPAVDKAIQANWSVLTDPATDARSAALILGREYIPTPRTTKLEQCAP